jgi:putative sterol carrier protein
MKTSELFEVLKEKAEKARPDLSAGFRAVALVDLTGADPAQWSLSAAEGRLTLAEGTPSEQPDISVTLAAETAAGIYLKTINPLAAFLTGKIKVKGDPAKITMIKQLLSKGQG